MTVILRRLCALILCGVMLISLCACGDKDDEEREAFADIAKILLACGVELTQDVFVVGLDADTPDSVQLDYANGTYYPVQSEKFTSTAQIKSAVEEIFTPSLAQKWLYAPAFDGTPPMYKDDSGMLYVNIAKENSSAFGVEWLYDTLIITEFSDSSAVITVETIVSDEPGHIREVRFERTAGGWRIASPLYGEGVTESIVSYTDAQQLEAAQNATSNSDLLS